MNVCACRPPRLPSPRTVVRSDVEARIEDAQYGAEREEDRRRYGHRAEMSNFVHCMVCFVFPSEGVKFYLSSCGHIACVKCVQKGSMTLSCKVCLKDNPQILEINRNLKPELRELFTPLDDFSKIVHEIGQVLDFQDAQRQHLMRHLQTKNNTFDKMQEFCKEEMKKKTQYKEALMRAKVEYKKKCDEIQELKSKLNKMERCSSKYVSI
ncbi:unnamed protein product [Heligmosomoides polygyrus]|uniref:RING-type domain-containing protein n=1 Tax=Heligmosomoides polygyrus TaxID=6339 RepID=A0A3P7WL47_HELPZ|nr:unnamed protein product [Heligmosomoides polygyrus]